MTRQVRIGLFAVSAAGLAALMLWGASGLPSFGHYRGPYGQIVNHVAPSERHVTNVVTAVVFDYRGVDTLGEEFILFAAAMGVALLLREVRDPRARRNDRVSSDAVRLAGVGFAAGLFVLGLSVVAHGPITPGGGFQGGVVLASAFALVYLAGDYRSYRKLTPSFGIDLAKGTGLGVFTVVGIVSLLLGTAYLHNFGPLGTAGTLASGGTISILNIATGLEVMAAFVLLFTEFLEELAVTRAPG